LQRPNQKGADTSLRLGDFSLRNSHYQTAFANRQPFAKALLMVTKSPRRRESMTGNRSRLQWPRDAGAWRPCQWFRESRFTRECDISHTRPSTLSLPSAF